MTVGKRSRLAAIFNPCQKGREFLFILGWEMVLPSSALASTQALAEAELVIVLQNPASHPPVQSQ